MLKTSSFWLTLCAAWDLACDRQLPGMISGGNGKNSLSKYAFNPIYALPPWGAAAGITAMIIGSIISSLLPVTGSAILFALLLTIAGELRTSGRGLALCVSSAEEIASGKTLAEARVLRTSFLRGINGLIPLLLAIGLLGGKFFAIMLIARTGHFGVTSAAMVTALSVEAVMASEPAASGIPRFCSQARQEYIIALAGFLLLFNLISLPLATLLATAVVIVIAITALNLCLRRCGEINSDDMTVTGYLVELAVWLTFMLLIA